ncbi:uncharacterized protein MKK02DRAFT_26112 [Dioszegia hungarica]|uniref:RRM domain-containing protein n=1 Tax=Dioszegia hungarica TaxID=4972 RepID=A0AA38H9B6_9TREE|nr:uncharacterized protein MKK02DRAFT_26112 [Dioszegia hungarica]KAI9636655.1 hypothetical protein MKK02DRAFT_26112 [Dioszegia hungarica]
MASAPQHPLPSEFTTDPRVFVDQQSGKHHYEDDNGQEWEWAGQVWIPLVDEDSWKAQQSAYAIAGVDENEPANAVVAREEKRNQQKRKRAGQDKDYTSNASTRAAASAAPHSTGPKKTGVFVSNLPPTATVSQLASVFSKAGVLLIGDDGEPRIKLYNDADGKFKGEALVIYFKEGSVSLAVTLLDDIELEMGAGAGNMRVKEAEYGDGWSGDKKGEADGRTYTAEEKQKMTKRIKMMQNKVTWHSDDDSDDPMAPIGGAPKPGVNRMARVVVLKGMFTLPDLDKDPALLLELKEDVREEAETMGQVTSVTLYDKEEDGVMTIKFKDSVSAEACVAKMNGRFFDKRRIQASIYTGKERFKRSGGRGLADEDDQRGETERLEGFANWLVDGSDNEE